MTKSNCTKRELFYRNLELFKSQIQVNEALNHISRLLETPLWELGVFSTSKGLLAGDLVVVYDDNEINYGKEKADIVPTDLLSVKEFRSGAKCILVVEKDTVLTRLIDDAIFDVLNVILITVSIGLDPGQKFE